MRIHVNGEAREVGDRSTVRDLLVALDLGSVLVAVERNRVIVPRSEHGSALLADGDEVEVVQFVGGG